MIRFVFILAGAVGGYQSAIDFGWPGLTLNKNLAIILYMILGSGVGYVIGGVVGRRLSRTLAWIEDTLQNMPIVQLLLGIVGLVTGLVIAFLVTLPFALIDIPVLRLFLTILAYAILAWLGLKVGAGRPDEFKKVINLDSKPASADGARGADKLLDTNIIIDGRVLDVVRTGFLEGRLILPRFVLRELHTIADSADPLKRARGRRGLDVLNAMQQQFGRKISITEDDYPEIQGVDAKLVRMAQDSGATVLTNDFNLAKVAQLEGVRIINLNDLASALKAVVLPGEDMVIRIVREGREPGQGVGYLEDGTMVVVEGGEKRIGDDVEIRVTSIIQTSAGKMVFTKIKAPEHA